MSDDLRKLVEDHLPRLAYQIMEPVVAIPNLHGRYNFMKSANLPLLHREGRLRYAGPQGEGYYYRPVLEGTKDDLMSQVYVAFHNIDLVDISDEEPQPVQVDDRKVNILEVLEEENDNASIKRFKINTSEAKDTSSEKTFEATAEAEFETSITRSAEAAIGPIKGKSEFMAKFRSKISASAGGAWRKSDHIEDHFHEEYDVLPFSHRQMTIKEGQPHIRQKIPTKGLLDCRVEIGIFNAGEWWFDHYDHIVRCWSGLRAGHEPFSSWFATGHAVPQEQIDKWERPYLNLDIEVEADRVRYYGKVDRGWPIVGHEDDYAKAKEAYFASIAAGKR